MLDDEQAQNGFGRRGVPSMDGGQPVAPDQITPDFLGQGVIVEQAIQLDQYRIRLVRQFGDTGKDVFGWIAVDQQGEPPQARVLP
jgi:hypothetical protein